MSKRSRPYRLGVVTPYYESQQEADMNCRSFTTGNLIDRQHELKPARLILFTAKSNFESRNGAFPIPRRHPQTLRAADEVLGGIPQGHTGCRKTNGRSETTSRNGQSRQRFPLESCRSNRRDRNRIRHHFLDRNVHSPRSGKNWIVVRGLRTYRVIF